MVFITSSFFLITIPDVDVYGYEQVIYEDEEIENKGSALLDEYIENTDGNDINIKVRVEKYDAIAVKNQLMKSNFFTEDGELIVRNDANYMRKAKQFLIDVKGKEQLKVNKKFLQELKFEHEVIYVNKYSPFISLSINKNDLDELLGLDSVKEVFSL